MATATTCTGRNPMTQADYDRFEDRGPDAGIRILPVKQGKAHVYFDGKSNLRTGTRGKFVPVTTYLKSVSNKGARRRLRKCLSLICRRNDLAAARV